jgi:HD superfamily phosphodiesterase
MRQMIDYHHYNREHSTVEQTKAIDRVAIYEYYVVDMLLHSEVKDEYRESSIVFELKHHHSTAQFARLLARQRNLPIDICTVGALLHDIYVIKYGKYKNHARESAGIALDILNDLGGFSNEEKNQILSIISNHSDKDVWSENPLEEFGKDVDILDSFLYPNAFEYYLKHKKLSTFYNYIQRAKKYGMN